MRADFIPTLPCICTLTLFSFILCTAIGDPGVVSGASASAREDSISERSGFFGISFTVPFLCHLAKNDCVLKKKCPESRRSWIFGCGSGNVCCKPEPVTEDPQSTLSDDSTESSEELDSRAEVLERSPRQNKMSDDCGANGGECSGNCTNSLENKHWKCDDGKKCCVYL
ncbi:uncharacterized protein LOC142796401 [Rhipicephalus microplus]|uniref:uncharacterized protein LOC142796401 n=1 Tax=Rhipicephalus microplus TaxID=6941 RepID=UPI003F6BD3F0